MKNKTSFAFISKLASEKQIPEEAANELKKLTPSNYLGHAPALARDVRRVLTEELGLTQLKRKSA